MNIKNALNELSNAECNDFEGVFAVARVSGEEEKFTNIKAVANGDKDLLLTLLAEASIFYAKNFGFSKDDLINELDAEMNIRMAVKGVEL